MLLVSQVQLEASMTTNKSMLPSCRPRLEAAAFALAVSAASLVVGCSPPADLDPSGTSSSSLGESRWLGAYKLVRIDRSQTDIAMAATRLANTAYSEAVAVEDVRVVVDAAELVRGSVHAVVPGKQPGLRLSHFRDNDALLVFNELLTRDTYSEVDVGPAAARAVFDRVYASALDVGGVNPVGMELSKLRLSYLIQGEGASGHAPVERIKEYVFTVPRSINGVEVFDAGFEVSIHRLGAVARLHTFGATVESVVVGDGSEKPTSDGYTFLSAVSRDDSNARVRMEYPNAEIEEFGLQYWLPEGTTSGIVEPRWMYFVSTTHVVDGKRVQARGVYVGYSAKETDSVPVVWPDGTVPSDVSDSPQ